MILGASLTRCSLPACACFTDGCVPLGGGFSRCSRWSSPGWRMHLPWRSGRLEGTDLAYLTRRPLTRVRVVVCSSLAPGSRITWLGSIDLQCTVLVLDVVTSGQSWIPTTFSSVGWLYTVGLQSSTRMNFRVDLAYACVPESVGVTIALALSLALSSRCVFSVGPAWLK